MTEEEKQAEAQRLRDEELEATKAELNRMKAIGAYKSISSEKVVENLIEAVSNADHNAIAKIFDAEIEARVKAEKTEWLKSRPQANFVARRIRKHGFAPHRRRRKIQRHLPEIGRID